MSGPQKRQVRVARGEVADELSRRLRVAKASAPSDARDAENARVRSLPIGDPSVLKGETADLLAPEPRVRAFRRVLSDPQKIRQNRAQTTRLEAVGRRLQGDRIGFVSHDVSGTPRADL